MTNERNDRKTSLWLAALPVLLYGAMLVLWLHRYYAPGTLVLGGEGDFVLDWKTYLRNYGFSWHPTTYGLGAVNFAPMGMGLNTLVLLLLETWTGNRVLVNYLLIYGIYFLPFLSFYLLSRRLGVSVASGFLCALLYVVNPFTSYYLSNLNQWNVFALTVMPLFFAIQLAFHARPVLLFFIFGLASSVFSFAYTNIPMFVVIHIALFMTQGFAVLIREGNFKPLVFLKRYVLVLFSFVIFNAWWIVTFLISMRSSTQIYTHSFAKSWLSVTVEGAFPILVRVFNLTVLFPRDPAENAYSFWYGMAPVALVSAAPFAILVLAVFLGRSDPGRKRLEMGILACLLAAIFLTQGSSGVFGFVYVLIFKFVPFFYIFKTPVEKFGLLYVFLLSVAFLVVFRHAGDNRFYRWGRLLFVVYLIFCTVPMWAGQLIPDYRIPYGHVTRQYRDRSDYQSARRSLNEDERVYRIMSFPGTGNYQVCFTDEDGRFYSGIDPLLTNTEKPALTSYTGMELHALLYENVGGPSFPKMMSLLGVRKVVLDENLLPWFGYVGRIYSPEKLSGIFASSMPFRKHGKVTVYENEDAFPSVYAAR